MLDCDVVVGHACDCGVAAALSSGGNLGRTWNPCCANQCRGDPSARKQSLSSFSNRPWRDGRGVAVDSQPGSPYGDRLTNRVQGRSPNNHHASSCSAVRLDTARGPITRCFPQRVVGRFRPFRRQCQKTLGFYKPPRGQQESPRPQSRERSGQARFLRKRRPTARGRLTRPSCTRKLRSFRGTPTSQPGRTPRILFGIAYKSIFRDLGTPAMNLNGGYSRHLAMS